MDFNNNRAIYEQMADRLKDEILSGRYNADERIPSVREYAALLQVNTNTAMRAYELLSTENIIYNRRGLGYFVAQDARGRIISQRKQAFFKEALPELKRHMDLLGITAEEVMRELNAAHHQPTPNGEGAAN